MDSLIALDIAIFRLLNDGLGTAWLDPVMQLLSSDVLWVAVAIALVTRSALRRRWRVIGFYVLVGMSAGASDLFSYQVLKPTIDRARPCHQLADVRLVAKGCGGTFGFPSNHAANGAAITTSAVVLSGSRRLLWLAVPTVLVGLSRVYVGVHFPGDVLVGFLVGIMIALLMYRVYGLCRKPLLRA